MKPEEKEFEIESDLAIALLRAIPTTKILGFETLALSTEQTDAMAEEVLKAIKTGKIRHVEIK